MSAGNSRSNHSYVVHQAPAAHIGDLALSERGSSLSGTRLLVLHFRKAMTLCRALPSRRATSRGPHDDHGLAHHRLPYPCNAHRHARVDVRALRGPNSLHGIPSLGDNDHSGDDTNMHLDRAAAHSAPQSICSGVPAEPSSPRSTQIQLPVVVEEVVQHGSVVA